VKPSVTETKIELIHNPYLVRVLRKGFLNQIRIMTNVLAAALRRAADIQDKIERLNEELSSILHGTEVGNARKRMGRPPGSGNKTGGRRKMSAAARAKIAAAAKARWAKAKAAGRKSL
jgi:hypothetical protein